MAKLCGAEQTAGAIEIGPGIGVLTAELSKVSKKVVAVEIDRRLLPVLNETLKGFDNVKIINADILKLDLRKLVEEEFSGEKVCVCANLPYYITSPIVMYLLENNFPLKSITVMVQKETAQRFCSPPGTKLCGAVSIGIHYRCKPEILFDVDRESFFPPPNVTSSVIRLEMLDSPPVQVNDERFFFKLSRSAFLHRRKTAVNSISSSLDIKKDKLEKALEYLNIPINIRAEKMTLEDFASLSNIIN